MAGTLVREGGERQPMTFTVRARASGPAAFWSGSPVRLEGDVTVGGVARGAPTTGTLMIRPLGDRELSYDLAFLGDDQATYRFAGTKNLTLLRLVHSMTTLRGTLYRESEPFGSATLTFALQDLPRFLASFRLGGPRAQR